MASAKAGEAANAVNSLLHLSSGDQQALLDVLEDYFSTPSETKADDSDLDDDSDMELEPESGTSGVHVNQNEGLMNEVVLHTSGDIPEGSESDDDELTTEQQIQEALQNIPSIHDLEVVLRPCDTNEEELVAEFVSTGCSCSKQCSSQFSSGYIQDMRAHCLELSRNELDMVLLGQLIASTNTSNKVAKESRHLEKERERAYTTYYHAGKVVCAKTFAFYTQWVRRG